MKSLRSWERGPSLKGFITYSGTVRIDGKVEGEIITQGKLVVGETAVINAEISAGTVICGGKISGKYPRHGPDPSPFQSGDDRLRQHPQFDH
ncbi:MAG: polymer-forming cytoskeletal protein [Candidatus Manganitrophus sp.]|nr:polymer-forming cytoskeletal protein [Candidatus Manganitrophus sp.]